MSSITPGVKIRLCPSWLWREGAFSSVMERLLLEHELALGRLEVVVVVELLATDELLELGWRAELVNRELALDQLAVGIGPFAGNAVDPKRLHGSRDVDRAVVHRVAEAGPDVAADDLAAALHHEAGHRPGGPEHDDRPPLLIDPGARADLALDDHVAAAQRGAQQRSGVAVDRHDAGHHVLARGPADAAGDQHLRAVDDPAGEVAEAALEGDPAAGQDPRAERMARAGVQHRDVAHALLVEQPAQLEVDPARGQLVGVERGAVAVDLADSRDHLVELDEPARVVAGLSVQAARAQRVHTITVPSWGS